MVDFLSNSEWDTPFFKKLAHNDTGSASGHQAGMVFPKDLRQYLPTLDATTSPDTPTVDRFLRVEMYMGDEYLQTGMVRYQFQTWGGERRPESRITAGLRPIRDRAVAGDLLLFQRRFDELNRFRLILIKQGTVEFEEISSWVGIRNWGPLFTDNTPATQEQLLQAAEEVDDISRSPFQTHTQNILRNETRQNRIARSSVFREKVRLAYENRCAVSGICIRTPSDLYEIESAHVIPLSAGGSDDVRNGIALAQSLHWAFDHGLFGVNPERRIYIPPKVKELPENNFLRQFENCELAEANAVQFKVHAEAFKWHMKHVVGRWD